MQLPNLDLVVDTYFPIKDMRPEAYLSQLRAELLPEIRKLEAERKIIWFGFLIHGARQLAGRVPPTDQTPYVHIRLGLPNGAAIDAFIRQLPNHFQQPQLLPVAAITGVDVSLVRDKNWAYAWKLHGEASDWVLRLIEAHDDDATISIQQVVQFLHFITNALAFGGQCLYMPGGFKQF